MSYVAYLRKSRADLEAEMRGEGETLAKHEALLKKLAIKMNLNVTAWYHEIVSGETIDARPVMQQLLNEVNQGLWEGVLVTEVERLARGDTEDQGRVARAFKYSNTKIITPIKTYDPNNEFDEEYFEFGLFMSRREFKTINRRIQRGRVAAIQQGKYISPTPPYGYIRVKIENDKGYTLKPHSEQADVVKLIYRLYTQEKIGGHRIAKELNRLGYKPAKTDSWSAASIRDILANPVYAGYTKWAERPEIKSISSGKIVKKRPKKSSDMILVPGLHEAIISPDTFQLAEQIRKSNTITRVNSKSEFKNPLAGLVICSVCGKKMQRQADSRRPEAFLHCEGIGCSNKASRYDYVEEEILKALERWLEEYKLNIKNLPQNAEKGQNIEDAISRLIKEKNTIQSQINRLHDLLEQGVYDADTFIERNGLLQQKKKAIEDNIKSLNQELKKEESRQKGAYEIIPKVENVLEVYYETQDAKEKNQMLKSVLNKVIYTKEQAGAKYQKSFKVEIYPKTPV